MERALVLTLVAAACAPTNGAHPLTIDRFSARAGHIMQRDKTPTLPAPDAPIDMEQPPFITQGLSPTGKPVRYYSFDVQPRKPAPVYQLVRDAAHTPVENQDLIIDVLPGDPGYSDFFQLVWVTVPPTFVAGSVHGAADLAGWPSSPSGKAIDCPVVPAGTQARHASATTLLYRGAKVHCLAFGEPLPLDAHGEVPVSPIYVTFGPAGFRTEGANLKQTHNVVFSLPGDLDYSPLWDVHVYDPARFDDVKDANSAATAPILKSGGFVNCPIVDVDVP